ncbi:MAG: hypothetical protein ACTJHT_09020 [Sphingobacterium sp.]|uniref:hypothetical protein n=1 Tax=Sphingobacterium sp. JB170 TaxID=1434842 RepID=UPI00211AD7FF|nr:hypothetical protein [Sphingobacterium sp. JB170]
MANDNDSGIIVIATVRLAKISDLIIIPSNIDILTAVPIVKMFVIGTSKSLDEALSSLLRETNNPQITLN